MKAYIKSYEEIKKVGLHASDKSFTDEFVMNRHCGKGPLEFIKIFGNNEEWFESVKLGYNWHISWLNPVIDYQYLLDFK